MNKLIVITGPTATGKTALAVKVAKKLNGEIISADSMQIYRGMDIGTAKVTAKETEGVPHFMLDIIEPCERFSVAQYRDRALLALKEISDRGHVPIVAGGTGLYINSLLFEMSFSTYNPQIKSEINAIAQTHTKEEMWQMLYQLDAERAKQLSVNDLKRVCRAIEIAKDPNSASCTDELSKQRLDADIYVLEGDRQLLYSRINQRVDKMFEQGLVEEVKHLIEQGCTGDCQSFGAIAYKETYQYLNGDYSYEELVDLIKQRSRNYAKRQLTWCRRYYPNRISLDYTDMENNEILIEKNY